MRKIPQIKMFEGLTPESKRSVKKISISERKYFNSKFFANNVAINEIADVMKNEFKNSQIHFAEFNRVARIIQENIITPANNNYTSFHSYTKKQTEALYNSTSKKFKYDSQVYINNLKVIEELEHLKTKIIEKEIEIEKIGNTLLKFISIFKKNHSVQYAKQNTEFILQFNCPTCNKVMRINEKKLVKISCPNCSYSFVVDTRDVLIDKAKIRKTMNKSKSIFTRIKHLIPRL